LADLVQGNASVTTTVVFTIPAVAPGTAGRPGQKLTPLGLPVPDGASTEPPGPGTGAGPGSGVLGPTTGRADGAHGAEEAGPLWDVAGEPVPADALPVIEVPGVGEVPGEVVRQVAAAFGTKAVLALCDWQSGTLASETCDAYTPPAWLKRLVRARDGTCRFPGCTIRAARCDIDHVIEHPRGPTEEPNLMSLCRHHHRLKQQERWQVTMTEAAVVTWTTPVGDQFTTWPVDHLGVRDLAS